MPIDLYIDDLSEMPSKRLTRIVFGTLVDSDDHIIDPLKTKEDVRHLTLAFKSISKTYKYSVISYEQHEDGRYHLHFVSVYQEAMYETQLNSLKTAIEKKFTAPCNKIECGSNVRNLIGYICKNYKNEESPSKILTDNIERPEVDEMTDMYLKKFPQDFAIKPAPRVIRSKKFDKNVKEMFIKEGLLLNPYLGTLYSSKGFVSLSSFINSWLTEGHPFYEAYGKEGMETLEKLITEGKILPKWEPDISIIEFTDAYYSLDTSEIIPKTDQTSYVPVRSFNFPIRRAQHLPTQYINALFDIFCTQSNVEFFRKAFALAFKPKRFRDRCLVLIGETQHGKSLITSPYTLVFKDVLGVYAEDSSFAFGPLARFPKVIANEFNPMKFTEEDQKTLKEIFEGSDSVRVKIKHAQPVEVIPKTIVIITNSQIKKNYDSEPHSNAIRQRLAVIHTIQGVDTQYDYYSYIAKETTLARITLWLTSLTVDYTEFKERPFPKNYDPDIYYCDEYHLLGKELYPLSDNIPSDEDDDD